MLNTSKRKSSKSKLHYVEMYEGIEDLPLRNLEKLLEGDLTVLLKRKEDVEFADLAHLVDTRDTIVDAFNKALDIDVENDEYFMVMIKLIEERKKFIAGDKTAINFVKLFEKELERMNLEATKTNFVRYRMQIQKWYGQPIDPIKTTAQEFIEMINLMKEEAEKQKQNGISKED